jgi:hypothetical protein
MGHMFKLLIVLVLYGSIQFDCFGQDKKLKDGNRNSSYLVRSTLGSCGLSKSIANGEHTYVIGQSVGQLSVIGVFRKNKYTVRQGFQQPLALTQIIKLPEKQMLKANIFPNPFGQSIHVSFQELISEELSILVHNSMGGISYYNRCSPAQIIDIPLNLVAPGNYILKISTGKKQLVSIIIKQ